MRHARAPLNRALTAALALLLVACEAAPARRAERTLASFSANEVAVTIAVEADSGGAVRLRASFAPTRSGLHLYSMDLPRDGLGGMGRPTLLEVVPSPAVRSVGALSADRAPVPLLVPRLGLTFPVYPDGPVTLRLPIAVTRPRSRVTLSVTYMACTGQRCFPPVIGRQIPVDLPDIGS